jgi:hypothetical protein
MYYASARPKDRSVVVQHSPALEGKKRERVAHCHDSDCRCLIVNNELGSDQTWRKTISNEVTVSKKGENQ